MNEYRSEIRKPFLMCSVGFKRAEGACSCAVVIVNRYSVPGLSDIWGGNMYGLSRAYLSTSKYTNQRSYAFNIIIKSEFSSQSNCCQILLTL
jgi:hypothetical protein